MKQITKILGRMEASLNGSLDGLQLDNTSDVIEKSLVIDMVNDLMMLAKEVQTEVKNISSNPMLADSKNLCGWVNVSDRLPNHNKEVLIIDTTCDDYYGIGSYTTQNGWAISGSSYWKPTHWKELDKSSDGR